MASTYSELKFELMATGENSGQWGTITNNNIGDAIEQALVGLGNPIFTTDANLTITLTNTVALQTARALVLNATSTGSLTATRDLVVPTIEKQYIVQNNTTGGQSITVKTTAGTGITVPNGKKMHLYVDGVNVVDAVSHFSSLTLASALPVLSGGTGVTTSTGTGAVVLSTSPTLVTPALGTPSALVGTNITGTATSFTSSNVTTNANLTGGVTSVGNAATVVTNANLTGDITSVGNTTTLTNAPVIAKVLTGYASGAGTVAATDSILQAIQKLNGNDATNANLTGAVTSVGNATSLGSFTSANLATAVTDETGTGALVFATSPTLVTPALGTPSSGVVTNLTGTASININGSVGATTANTGAFTTLTASINLSSTRINPRTSTVADTATLTPDISTHDQFNITAQAQALTIAAPIGTPVDGNKLILRILDNGTSRALAFNATYTVIGTTLPTATTINKMLYVGCIFNSTNARWDVIAVTTQA